MEIIGTDVSQLEQKNKKLMKIIVILIIILTLISFGIMGLIYYLQSTEFKFILDGLAQTNYASDLFVFEEDNIYISIKDMSKLVGYSAYNGAYGSQDQYSEDTTKCYVEGDYEVASFELDSNKIYKIEQSSNNNQGGNYEYFDIDEPVKQINNKLYTTIQGISRAFNVSCSYNEKNNQISMYTLEYLDVYYSSSIPNAIIDASFNNQKALLYNLVITSNQAVGGNVRYGIYSMANKKEIVGTKYKDIQFVESMKEFLVTTVEGKMGIISLDGTTKVQPQYDSLKQIDQNLNLYLATNNNKQGIIEQNGKILIYLEYDKIGINKEDFPTNDIKNPYLLYDNCIPVCQNGKWGMYDKTGKIILPIQYDTLGCIVSGNNFNSVLVIPEVNGIVVGQKYNNQNYYFGIVDNSGTEIIPFVLDAVYSVTASGREEYSMTNAGNTFDVVKYINENL